MSEVELDAFHGHEVLHSTYLINSIFEDFVRQHRFTQSDAALRNAAENVAIALGNFYQLVGEKTL